MRIVMFAGSHPRHLYIADVLSRTGFLAGIVMEKRENMILEIPEGLDSNMKMLYSRHFELRLEKEEKYFGNVDIESLLVKYPVLELEESELNSKEVEKFVKKLEADTLIAYGPGLIKENILNLCPDRCFNLHGGLSPYYKGAATMFWPFYFLEPNYVGTTFHHITMKIDGGKIIHQSVPELEYGDGMHEVACKAIVAAGNDLLKLIPMLMDTKTVQGVEQRKNGKLFLEKDWRPEHLRIVYELYGDKIVDLYLDGVINKNNNPRLIRAW